VEDSESRELRTGRFSLVVGSEIEDAIVGRGWPEAEGLTVDAAADVDWTGLLGTGPLGLPLR
jgi:hypothetical protein